MVYPARHSPNLRQPLLHVVAIRDAADAAVMESKECRARHHVFLSARRRHADVVGDVFAMHHVFGGGALAVGRAHHHHVAQLLVVAGFHPLQERGERGTTDFARALVELVDDVLAEQGEHAVDVVAVERGVVVQHQLGGAVVAAGAVDLHGDGLAANRAGSASGSTLPPDRMTPTRWPAKRSRCRNSAASTVADEGSTSCFIRVHSRRIAATVSASSTVSTSTAWTRSRSKFGAPSVPRRPSQIVSGTRSVTRVPRCSEANASAAPAGSAA